MRHGLSEKRNVRNLDMAAYELKTKKTEVGVEAFIDSIENETRRKDSHPPRYVLEKIDAYASVTKQGGAS